MWTASTFTSGIGYGQFHTTEGPKVAHRVAWLFGGKTIPDGMLVLHKCDNPRCVRLSHLFLGTHQDNMDDKCAKGRHRCPSGSNHPGANFSPEEVRKIRGEYVPGLVGYKRLAKKYHTDPMTVARMVRGKTYKKESN